MKRRKLSLPRQRIMEYLEKIGRPAGPLEVASRLQASPGATRYLLAEMARTGQVLNPHYGAYAAAISTEQALTLEKGPHSLASPHTVTYTGMVLDGGMYDG
jgi:hypothetical protein